MSILTGDFAPSSGDGFLNGSSVTTELGSVRRIVGYCPQFDPLLGYMTATETLVMFGRLKGVPEGVLTPLVTELIERVGLHDFKDCLCGGYSGGNKRKLSLAIALIGRPKVVFLDEPSTGNINVKRALFSLVFSLFSCCRNGPSRPAQDVECHLWGHSGQERALDVALHGRMRGFVRKDWDHGGRAVQGAWFCTGSKSAVWRGVPRGDQRASR